MIRALQRTLASPPWRTVVCALWIGTQPLVAAGCAVGFEAGAEYPVYDDYPSDAFIATTEPVYFEGRATYWYGGRWWYRDGRRWGHYDREPPNLYQRRISAPPRRRMYEPPSRPRPAGRYGVPTGGGRGGGHR